ncbi:MAG: hypothetical protein JJ693_01485 [Acidithiobacillus sp.]|nr:hypothetical protein [Acidithiobacillus sp.]
MKKMEMSDRFIRLEFDKKDLPKIVEPIIKNAEQFSATPLDMAYLLAEVAYRMENHFRQPKGVFDGGLKS